VASSTMPVSFSVPFSSSMQIRLRVQMHLHLDHRFPASSI
jgi:hypothetical protein